MKILVKFPTRSRPERFFNCLSNMLGLSRQNPEEPCIDILVSMDNNDPTMCGNEVRTRLEHYPRIHPVWGESRNKIDAVNRDINQYQHPWDILIVMSDDMRWVKEAWDRRITIDMAGYFPDTDGLLHYPDGSENAYKLATMPVIGRKYYERDRYVYWHEYESVYPDNEQIDVAKIRGRHKLVDEQLFSHDHPSWLKMPWDALALKNESPELKQKDETTYNRRKASNFFL